MGSDQVWSWLNLRMKQTVDVQRTTEPQLRRVQKVEEVVELRTQMVMATLMEVRCTGMQRWKFCRTSDSSDVDARMDRTEGVLGCSNIFQSATKSGS